MISEVNEPIRYFLDLNNDFIEMNQCIDHQISLNMMDKCVLIVKRKDDF